MESFKWAEPIKLVDPPRAKTAYKFPMRPIVMDIRGQYWRYRIVNKWAKWTFVGAGCREL